MEKFTRKALLAAVVTGLVTVGLSARAGDPPKASQNSDDKKVECPGGNSCKGKGDCGGPGYSCAGNNPCCSKGFVNTSTKEECDALVVKVKKECTSKGSKKKKAKSA